MRIYLFFISTLIILIHTLNAKDIKNISNDNIPAIISIDWLKQNQSNKNLIILDLRDYIDYKNGHIKNAINVPELNSFFYTNTWIMPKLNNLKNLFSNAGIDNESLVVLYGDNFLLPAKIHWTLEVLGHNNVGILQYTYGNFIEDNLPISNIESINIHKDFIPMINHKQIETKLSTLLSIGQKTIIDGRDKLHYLGQQSSSKRFGHIPTAYNYVWKNNYTTLPSGEMKIKELSDLKRLYNNIPAEKDIILYCQSGEKSALNYVILQELGYNVSIYNGSWNEWGNDSNLPIENNQTKSRQ